MMPGRSKETSMARLIARPAFMTFLVNAKRQTYAAQGDDATVTPLVPGSRQLEYQEGALLYRDIYFGGAYFVGQETVYEGPTPVWAMGYGGGVIPSSLASRDVGQHGGLVAAEQKTSICLP
jgi:hypothetical protein